MIDVSDINLWMKQHNAEDKAYKGFFKNLESYRHEEPEEFSRHFQDFEPNLLEIKIESVSINFSNNYPNFDYNHVIITIPINWRKRSIGYYKLLLNFDGVPDDDYFVIH